MCGGAQDETCEKDLDLSGFCRIKNKACGTRQIERGGEIKRDASDLLVRTDSTAVNDLDDYLGDANKHVEVTSDYLVHFIVITYMFYSSCLAVKRSSSHESEDGGNYFPSSVSDAPRLQYIYTKSRDYGIPRELRVKVSGCKLGF
eukprot:763199-Hanusia_phi.AAC.4